MKNPWFPGPARPGRPSPAPTRSWPPRAKRAAEVSGRGEADLLVRAWRAAGPWQAWLAWRLHARFGVGVTGVVRAGDGRVLLLRHRLWAPEAQWGFPSGFARRGETFQQTVVREVGEETGLTVRVGRLLELRSGFRYRVEAYYEAALPGGLDGLDGLVLDEREILEARLFTLDALPPNMPPLHRKLALG